MGQPIASEGEEVVRVATYNLENYVLVPTGTRPAKTEASRAKIAGTLAALRADILGLQEVGGLAALEDIRRRSGGAGCEYPYWEHVVGSDTNIQVALVSRFPITARRSHTNAAFLLGGRRHRVSRGFAEVDVAVARDFPLTVFVAHLKSRRTIAEADETELRREEARLLREKIELRLRENPRANVVVLGDFNDTRDSEPVRLLVGRGRHQLLDTRPAERNGDTGYTPNARGQPRTVTWTYHYGVEDTYSRIDYVLLHGNLQERWRPGESYLLALPDWGLASDHRPAMVTLAVPTASGPVSGRSKAASEVRAEGGSVAVVGVRDVSFRNELQHAVDRGLAWLQAHQDAGGWWSTPEHPAVTGLALMAFLGEPRGRYRENRPDYLERGFGHLLASVQRDGGIHRTNLVTYNTSISMMALLAAGREEYRPVILRARRFLIGLQGDHGEPGRLDTPFDGGIGYGTKYEHSDMGNTLQALEALYYSRTLVQDNPAEAGQDLNWAAAIRFLQHCQNLPSHNSERWASDAPENKGGFIYYPGHSMAGGTTNAVTGRVALRSYGSISYGGLLSYIYADLKRDDPRVAAVHDWLLRNYTLEENPGLGLQGLYYYFHTMAKALTAFGVDELRLPDGRKVAWRRELSQRLLDLQQKDGSWANDNGRWWERDPALVTSYAVLALEIMSRGL